MQPQCNNPSHYYHYNHQPIRPSSFTQRKPMTTNNNVQFDISDFNEAGENKLKMILMTITGLDIKL